MNKATIKKVELNGDRLDIDMDVVLPGNVREIDIILSLDEFWGKTVCKKCKFFDPDKHPFHFSCEKGLDKIKDVDFIMGNVFYNDMIPMDKNKNGDCSDFFPLDLEERLDFLLEKGRKRLDSEIFDIFYKMEISNRMIGFELRIADSIIKALKDVGI